MGTFQKILTTSLWALTVVCMVFIVTAGIRIKENNRRSADVPATAGQWMAVPASHEESAPAGLPVLFGVPAFSLVDQDGKPFANEQLNGKPWVCEFVFTSCQSICPIMFQKMESLQKALDARVQLVSFSVDPDTDRPAMLKVKADSLHADGTRWHLLTNGDGDKKGIDQVQRGFFEAKPGAQDAPTMHSPRFFLIDGSGHCRGIYTSTEPDAMDKLKQDVTTVLAETP